MSSRVVSLKHNKEPQPQVIKIPTNTQELREFLVTQMIAAAKGDLDSGRARSVVAFAQQIYNSLTLELRAAGMTARGQDNKIQAIKFK